MSTMVLSAAANRLSQSLVACNVYVSAGGKPNHAVMLLNLLKQAQDHCQRLDERNTATSRAVQHDDTSAANSTASIDHQTVASKAAIVHAYTDPVYNRSSFHLAGTAANVAAMASSLATQAVQVLRKAQQQKDQDDPAFHHPFVGLVDHVTVMDLIEVKGNVGATLEPPSPSLSTTGTDGGTPVDGKHFQSSTASAWAAQSIGKTLSQLNVHVLYYGDAHPDSTLLAIVRRERTNFFRSGGLLLEDANATAGADDDTSPPPPPAEVATVKAPTAFVENYNVRLTAACSKTTAQSLTKTVRERDGGLVGVEALTLPYSNGRWEVACNLLQPHQASASDIQSVVDQWETDRVGETGERLVEQGYRVGTTAEQCIQVLNQSVEERKQHDEALQERLQAYMQA
jgi:hypothetical protein